MSQLESTSKFLSLILRHQPEVIGLRLDREGWANISELIELANKHGRELDRELLKQVVDTNSKKRFSFSDDLSMIRANQGHSVSVDLGLQPVEPPRVLYHGTATRFLDSIREQGLRPGTRQHVHLSKDAETAMSVGRRHGKPVVLIVDAKALHDAGHKFFLSDNGVWLTHRVPVHFIDFDTQR
jgi:putative RNA 2'-phosphotransferase